MVIGRKKEGRGKICKEREGRRKRKERGSKKEEKEEGGERKNGGEKVRGKEMVEKYTLHNLVWSPHPQYGVHNRSC